MKAVYPDNGQRITDNVPLAGDYDYKKNSQ